MRPAIAGNLKLRNDFASSHTYSKVTQYLTINGITTTPWLPYSSDLASENYSLFPKVKPKGTTIGPKVPPKKFTRVPLKTFRNPPTRELSSRRKATGKSVLAL